MSSIINSIDSKTDTIIWITKDPLLKQIPTQTFKDLDYLFDGLLSKYCHNIDTNNDKAFFSNLSFDKYLYLGHICNKDNSLEEIEELIKLVKNLVKEETITIRIIGKHKISAKQIEYIKNKHSQIRLYSSNDTSH